jgi:hypothetical protein
VDSSGEAEDTRLALEKSANEGRPKKRAAEEDASEIEGYQMRLRPRKK